MIVDCPKNPFLLPGLGHHGQYDTGNNVNQWDNSGHGKRSLYRSHSEAGGHPWQSDQDTWQEKDPVSRMVRATDTVDRQLLEYLARDETTNSAQCAYLSVVVSNEMGHFFRAKPLVRKYKPNAVKTKPTFVSNF